MRTTLDLPDELFREAKIVAINRGITLKDLMTGALEKEIHGSTEARPKGRRLDFPLIKSTGGKPIIITPEIIREIEDEDLMRGVREVD